MRKLSLLSLTALTCVFMVGVPVMTSQAAVYTYRIPSDMTSDSNGGNYGAPFESMQRNYGNPFESTQRNYGNPFESTQRNYGNPFESTQRNYGNPFENSQGNCSDPLQNLAGNYDQGCQDISDGQNCGNLLDCLDIFQPVCNQDPSACQDGCTTLPELPTGGQPALPGGDTSMPSLPGGGEENRPELPDEDQNKPGIPDSSYAQEILSLVNAERAKAGAGALTLDASAEQAADTRAQEIQQSFSHTRPDGRDFSTALTEAGVSFRTYGENIAYGQNSAQEVMTGWMNSAGHRANILNRDFTSMGVGHTENGSGVDYWTQLFFN